MPNIEYYVNGIAQGIAFDEICFKNDDNNSMKVRLDESMSVQLLDFHHML